MEITVQGRKKCFHNWLNYLEFAYFMIAPSDKNIYNLYGINEDRTFYG